MYTLDLHDSGYWLIRHEDQTWPAGMDKARAEDVVEKLNSAHRPNLELRNDELYVCYGGHERAQDCSYQLAVMNVYGRDTVQQRAQKIVEDENWLDTDWVYDGIDERPVKEVDRNALEQEITTALREAKRTAYERCAQIVDRKVAELRNIAAAFQCAAILEHLASDIRALE